MEEEKKNPLFFLLVLVLFMSCILPLFAVPLSRKFASEVQEPPVQLGQGQVVANREVQKILEHFGRMNIEVNDYPGSGANNRHDPPKSPGTA